MDAKDLKKFESPMKRIVSLKKVLADVRACRLCEKHLPHGPRPIVAAHRSAKLLIIGQAPGKKVHESGIPWEDASGTTLRSWLGINRETFYDATQVALVPMGFCYPGKGPSGDLPPREECAPQWHQPIMSHLNDVKLTILIGQYAQEYYLKARKETLTATVKAWREYVPVFLPLPHPSPRNFIWMSKNPWFMTEVVPFLRKKMKSLYRFL